MLGKTKFFSPNSIIEKVGTSPARVYADCFLYEKLEEIISKKEISILDIGCGSGYVREIFNDLGYKVDYNGVDIIDGISKSFKDFEKYAISSNFTNSKIGDFRTDKKFDLVMSMFALEHIKDDKLAVAKTKSLVSPNGVQLHMVPSKWSFLLYFTHGHRRYSPRRINKMFPNSYIYRVGGFFSFLTHFIFITIGKKIFKKTKTYESDKYVKILRLANKLDRVMPIFPIAYIIVNFNNNEHSKL